MRRRRAALAAAALLLSGCLAPFAEGRPLSSLQRTHARPQDARALGRAKLALLLPCWERQKTPSGCSVATGRTLLCALLRHRGRPPPSQAELLATDPSGSWAQATNGADAAGTTLDRFALLLLQASGQLGLRRVGVEVVHVAQANAAAAESLAAVLERMQAPQDLSFVAVNFLQSSYLRDGAPVGHLSVVGAYDPAAGQVLILDVDDVPRLPYWVSLRRLLEGMRVPDAQTGEPRGYLVLRQG